MNGVLIVDKPIGKTSFDMIRDVRKEYGIKKVGHIGTLDPMATGVLPILIGEATKLSDYLMEHDKEYIATLKLGEKRDTGDSEGKIIETKEVNNDIFEKLQEKIKEKIIKGNGGKPGEIFTEKVDKTNDLEYVRINDVFKKFLGETMQIPPMYSALKINGQKLYDLARQGQTVERQARKIIISQIDIINVDEENKEITFRVVCSKGTYIRVLCEDVAERLGTCGYMKSLRRTRVGNFKIEDVGKFIELENIFTDIPKINVTEYKELINGVPIELKYKNYLNLSDNKCYEKNKNNENNNINKTQTINLCNLYYNGKFIGIGEIKENKLKRKIII